MAANIQLGEGTSGKYSKTTEVSSGVHIGCVELVTSAGAEIAPLTDTQLRATAVPISVATIPSHAVTNAGTFAVQADITKIAGASVVVDNGSAATSLRVTLANDSTGQVKLAAGTAGIGKLTANSGVDIGDVDILSIAAGDNNIGNVDVLSISAGANLIGNVGISGARTSGGTTPYKNLDVDETEDEVKGSAGQVYWIHAVNLKATPLFLKFYNATAASVQVGTTVPVLTFPVPSAGATTGAGFNLAIPNGIVFDTAITIAATTGVADNDTGAPGANELIVNLGYA